MKDDHQHGLKEYFPSLEPVNFQLAHRDRRKKYGCMPAKCPHTLISLKYLLAQRLPMCARKAHSPSAKPARWLGVEKGQQLSFEPLDTCHQVEPEQEGQYPQVFLRVLDQSNTGSLCSHTSQFHRPVWSESGEYKASGIRGWRVFLLCLALSFPSVWGLDEAS